MGNPRNPPSSAQHFPPLGAGTSTHKKAPVNLKNTPWKSALVSGLVPTEAEAPQPVPLPLDRKAIEEIWALYPPPYDISGVLDESFLTSKVRSNPWLQNTGHFHERPVITEADLALPKVEVNLVDNVLVLDIDDIVPVHIGWGYCLLGFFAGKFPGVAAIQKMAHTWICCPRISYHSSGWLLFRFEFQEEMECVLHAGPYAISGIHLNLCRLPEFFRFDAELDFKFPPLQKN